MTKKTKKFAPWMTEAGSFGEGGQGEVFLVRHETNDPPGEFVLKRLKNPKRQARFDQELKSLLAVAGHPNVVALVDTGAYRDDKLSHYVMEKADGSLAGQAPRRGYPPVRAFEIYRDVLAGVKTLHDAKIIHRDIKPDNVLMFGARAKIADTGLCLIAEDERFTPTFEAVGPRYYMAPELEGGRNLDVDYRADLYSLGKLLYWLLSGGTTLVRETFRADGHDLARTRAPGLEPFNAVFERTLTTNTKARYASIDVLAAAFERAVVAYNASPDTRLAVKLARSRTFQTAFRKLRIDEKAAAIKRAELGLLGLSADDLIFVAEHDPRWRNQKLLALLDKQIAPDDARVPALAKTFAQTDEGLGEIHYFLGPKALIKAMLSALLAHGTHDEVTRLAKQSASPFNEFTDLVPALLARFPPPVPVPTEFVGIVAAFPQFARQPWFVDLMLRAATEPDVSDETLGIIAFGLSRSSDLAASPALDTIISGLKGRPDALVNLIPSLVVGGNGSSKLRQLALDEDLPEHERGVFAVAVEVMNEAANPTE